MTRGEHSFCIAAWGRVRTACAAPIWPDSAAFCDSLSSVLCMLACASLPALPALLLLRLSFLQNSCSHIGRRKARPAQCRGRGARRAVWLGLHPVAQRQGAGAEARCMQGHAQGNRAYKATRKAMVQQGYADSKQQPVWLSPPLAGGPPGPATRRAPAPAGCAPPRCPSPARALRRTASCWRQRAAPGPAQVRRQSAVWVWAVGGGGWDSAVAVVKYSCSPGRMGSRWRPRGPALRTPAPPLRMAHPWAGILPASLLGAPAGCCPR